MNDTDKIISAVEKAMEKAGVVGGDAFHQLTVKTYITGAFGAGISSAVFLVALCLTYLQFKRLEETGKEFDLVIGVASTVVAIICFLLFWPFALQFLVPEAHVIENILSRL